MKKIAVFVDVQNIYYTVRDTFGRRFNYALFWQELSVNGHIDFAFAYAIDSGDPQQAKFQHKLREIGFDVKLKPYITRTDGSAKGDWDVGITIDIMEHASLVDEIILASGDGDFDRLLKHVVAKNKVTTSVYGIEALTAQSLIRSADRFRPITQDLLF